MNESQQRPRDQEPMSLRERVDKASDEFERQWRAGEHPRIEDFLERARLDDREYLLRELIELDMALRREAGEQVNPEEYHERFADQTPVCSTVDGETDQDRDASAGHSPASGKRMPQAIGRYRILRVLGQGAFAVVYLAHDMQLDRQVALKVPRMERFDSNKVLDLFVQEARNAAQLNHPSIVGVYDVRREPELVYIVQHYIPGGDLAHHLKANRLSHQQIAELLINVAEAVGYAHERGYWHRDLKPANILIDGKGKPYVTDFGLALHDSMQSDRAGEVAGTPAYMSPEQVRGEAHRLDGRTDIWSLGVILYELLTGRRPFAAEARQQLLDEILYRDPPPPHMIVPAVPRELARISLTCLAKRATDRYQAAPDLIDDLRHWLVHKSTAATGIRPPVGGAPEPPTPTPIKIIPKGLDSYDANDADFFLELLPGPHDREGLPKGVRFWKMQIEKTDPDETFTVGIMYGPSGSGKSSLVKAGLLPRLNKNILPLYVEANVADTEVRLIKALRKRCPELPGADSLPEMIAHLRSSGGSRGRKVLIVLDQFEQWLHSHESREHSQLVRALRQCDGGGVQCLVLVRDDFYASLNRFCQHLEVPIVEGHNLALVDLFDADHAGKVLLEFGRAYGKLPETPTEPDSNQARFLQRAVEGLAQDGKVICVRLAVFAEMMKGRPWTDKSLNTVGGTEGVGVTFLEEKLDSAHAPPDYRLHDKALRAVLLCLLPEQGSALRGVIRSRSELLEASGYTDRDRDFDRVLRILNDLRLITPTDPEGATFGEHSHQTQAVTRERHYQLTHDYLVTPLHTWLNRKRGETRRGRAEILLEERTREWNPSRQDRLLPSPLETMTIIRRTAARQRTESQRQMLSRAVLVHGRRLGLAVALMVVVSVAVVQLLQPTSKYELMQQFIDEERSVQSRRDAFDRLELNDVYTFTHLVDTLRSTSNPGVVVHAFAGLAELVIETGGAPQDDDPVRRDIVELASDLVEHPSQEVALKAFDLFASFSKPQDVLEAIRRGSDRFQEEPLGHEVNKYIRQIDLDKLSDKDRLDSIPQLLEIIHEEQKEAMVDVCVQVLDREPADRFITSLIEAYKHSDAATATNSALLPYMERVAKERRFEIGQLMEGRLQRLASSLDSEFSANLEPEFLILGLGRLQRISASEIRFEEALRIAADLLQRPKQIAPILASVIEGFAGLNIDRQEPCDSLRAILLDESAPVTARPQAARSLGDLDDIASLHALKDLAARPEELVNLRREAVVSLGRMGQFLAERRLPEDDQQIQAIVKTLMTLIQRYEQEPFDVVRAAVLAFGQLAEPHKAKVIFPLLLDRDMNLSAISAVQLILLRHPEGLAPAVEDYLLWRSQVDSLPSFMPHPDWAVHLRNADLHIDQIESRAETTKAVISSLIDAHSHENPRVRTVAANLFSMMLILPQDHPPKIDADDPEDRCRQVELWKDWWQHAKDELQLKSGRIGPP